jgi:hypothetical protein
MPLFEVLLANSEGSLKGPCTITRQQYDAIYDIIAGSVPAEATVH